MAGINVGGSAHGRRSRIVEMQSTLIHVNPSVPVGRAQDRAVPKLRPHVQKGNLLVLAKLIQATLCNDT